MNKQKKAKPKRKLPKERAKKKQVPVVKARIPQKGLTIRKAKNLQKVPKLKLRKQSKIYICQKCPKISICLKCPKFTSLPFLRRKKWTRKKVRETVRM